MEYDLGDFTNFKNAFALTDTEVWRYAYFPFRSLLSDIADDDGFFCFVLDRNQTKVELVREVKHCAATTCSNRHNELLSLSHDH